MTLEVLYQELADAKQKQHEIERRIAEQTGTTYLEVAHWIPQTQAGAVDYYACQWCGAWFRGKDIPNYSYCPRCGKAMAGRGRPY